MTERNYFFLVGVITLIGLYLEWPVVIFTLTGVLLFESLTNLRIPKLIQQLQNLKIEPGLRVPDVPNRFTFTAARAWHLNFAIVVLGSYVGVSHFSIEFLWFIPWFMAIAALSAAISNFCPVYTVLVYAGFSDK